MPLSAAEPPKKFVDVLGHRMAYVEMGEGAPIVFQHGNPTSSYLWRNIMPYLAGQGRCIALDLIGMGSSDKLSPSGPDRYRFVEHGRFFDAALEALGIASDVTFVIHDWGSALGFDWANRHRDAVKGIAYMEAVVRPVSGQEWPEQIRPLFQGFRSQSGEAMVLEKNIFVERVLPGSVLRKLTEEEMECLSPSLPGAGRRSPPDANVAAADPDRGRTGRCGRDRAGLWRLDEQERHPETVRQCGARRHPDRGRCASSAARGRTSAR